MGNPGGAQAANRAVHLARLVRGAFPEAAVIYTEEKQSHKRHEYESPFEAPLEIQADLLRAATDVRVPDVHG